MSDNCTLLTSSIFAVPLFRLVTTKSTILPPLNPETPSIEKTSKLPER